MTPGAELVTVYVTCASPSEAAALGRTLVEERLAACANVLPGVTSIYQWQGAVQQDAETALLLKTRASLFRAVERRLREQHGYEVPCIVAWPLEAVSEPYARWVREQTRDA
ncbi:MAG TPA: divalent-cation tolerance protein CutA [Planctomycetota bacterium]|nr:divalent-cation tolerance protein CutA [Planctomycetota bacterium]